MRPILHAAHRASRWLDATLGPVYRVVLAAGLLLEMGHHTRDIIDSGGQTPHLERSLMVIVLCVALLISTFAGLYEVLARRAMRGR